MESSGIGDRVWSRVTDSTERAVGLRGAIQW